MAVDLRNWALPTATREHLSAERNRLEDEISRLVNSRKQLEADVSLKKKISQRTERFYKKFRAKKRKSTHQCQLRLITSCFSIIFQQLPTMVVSLVVSTVMN
jgi:hypothetical protein